MKLRDYQQRAIDMLYNWFGNNDGNPCLALPTGSGKSVIIASLIKDALQNWPETRVLMLTHVKELILQNAEKMNALWPAAPMGIYSAGIGKKQLGEPITFAGIQSIWKRSPEIGHIDLVIIDEAHLINHSDTGQYRSLLSDLKNINPHLRVIGLTATPYRLGHGFIHDGEGTLFDDIIEPVSIEELVYLRHLAPLSSKHTSTEIDVSDVQKRGGEFIPNQLEIAVDKAELTKAIVRETLSRAEHCQSMLFFCTGVAHAEHMAMELIANGVSASVVTGETPKGERAELIKAFKEKRIKALTNANVLTTGFDAPDIDCIVMARPTMSPGLYVQMAGRGMRLKSHTDHCLVLDFAGNVSRHGPITAIAPPSKKGKGEAPTKTCPECQEIVHAAVKNCSTCDYLFPSPEKEEAKEVRLYDDDIMGLRPQQMKVSSWRWRKHIGKASGKEMLTVTYYGLATSVIEYVLVANEGYAGDKARRLISELATLSMTNPIKKDISIEELAETMNTGSPPQSITYRMDGKFFKVLKRDFEIAAH